MVTAENPSRFQLLARGLLIESLSPLQSRRQFIKDRPYCCCAAAAAGCSHHHHLDDPSSLSPCFDALFYHHPSINPEKRRERKISTFMGVCPPLGGRKSISAASSSGQSRHGCQDRPLLNTHQDTSRGISLSLSVSIATNFFGRKEESDVWAGSGSIHQDR